MVRDDDGGSRPEVVEQLLAVRFGEERGASVGRMIEGERDRSGREGVDLNRRQLPPHVVHGRGDVVTREALFVLRFDQGERSGSVGEPEPGGPLDADQLGNHSRSRRPS